MTKILEATYSNGTLILSEALDPALEGKKLQVMILDDEGSHTEEDAVDRRAKVKRFLEQAKKYSAQIPADYKFNREELYER